METILEKFAKHARAASYHYADDSCKEWGLAKQQLDAALQLFDGHPELQAEMREAAKDELWSLSMERPQGESQ